MKKSLKEKYKINIDDYKIIRKINQGGFGIIYLVQNKNTKEELVAKVNTIDTDIDDRQSQFVRREVSILMNVQHQTIIPLRGFSLFDFNKNKNITILMDYMEQGSLSLLLDKEQKGLCPLEYDNTKRQIILAGVARGMMLLHSKNVIHRDLTSGNILLDKNFYPRITDFGLSKYFDPNNSKSQTLTDCGTAAYMAPEVIESDRYNTKADVYSFGILMFEIITGTKAYSELLTDKKVNVFTLKKKVTEGYRPQIKIPIKKGLKKLILQCFSANPRDRPTFCELFQKLSLSSADCMLQFESPQNFNEDELFEEDDIDDYCLDDVDVDEFLTYIEEITVETGKNNELETRLELLEKSQNEKINEMSETIKNQANQIRDLQNTIKIQKNEIAALKGETNSPSPTNFGRFFCVEPSFTEPGIFCQLKSKEKNKFDPLIVASSSARDIYNLIDPNTTDTFGTSKTQTGYFIEFSLKDPILINGLQIVSGKANFPKSFDIQINRKTVKSISMAEELNGPNKTMTINFSEIKGKDVRFVKKGPSWDKDVVVFIKRFEILSPESRFSEGVFATLINESKEKDPHKCGVLISSSSFDFNSFHLLDSIHKTFISSHKSHWFQVELTHGSAIITGFRIKKSILKNYKITASDDQNKPDDSWLTLFEVSEEVDRKMATVDVFELPHPSPLVRFIRVTKTGPNWEKKDSLMIHHFDIFGYYF